MESRQRLGLASSMVRKKRIKYKELLFLLNIGDLIEDVFLLNEAQVIYVMEGLRVVLGTGGLFESFKRNDLQDGESQ